MQDLGKLVLFAGLGLVVLGALLLLAGKVPWFGRLPGDIVYESPRVKVYFPLVTSLILSLVLTLALWLFRR